MLLSPHLSNFKDQMINTLELLDFNAIEAVVAKLCALRQQQGRLFILGVGGSAANASHAVNDFRKIGQIEAYAPTDNVSELTARTNDDGWQSIFVEWLKCSRLNANDAVMIFSVGGGSIEQNLSVNLIKALDFAKSQKALTITIAARKEAYCLQQASHAIYIPVAEKYLLTPISEAVQAAIWHAIISHPDLQASSMTWEKINRV